MGRWRACVWISYILPQVKTQFVATHFTSRKSQAIAYRALHETFDSVICLNVPSSVLFVWLIKKYFEWKQRKRNSTWLTILLLSCENTCGEKVLLASIRCLPKMPNHFEMRMCEANECTIQQPTQTSLFPEAQRTENRRKKIRTHTHTSLWRDVLAEPWNSFISCNRYLMLSRTTRKKWLQFFPFLQILSSDKIKTFSICTQVMARCVLIIFQFNRSICSLTFHWVPFALSGKSSIT